MEALIFFYINKLKRNKICRGRDHKNTFDINILREISRNCNLDHQRNYMNLFYSCVKFKHEGTTRKAMKFERAQDYAFRPNKTEKHVKTHHSRYRVLMQMAMK